MPDKKKPTPAEALSKCQKYCAYQERSHREVREKLYSFGLHYHEVEEALTLLITNGFLNEERFAKSFAGGKFRMKRWGKNKIEHELKLRDVSKRNIQIGLKEIDDDDYRKVLLQEIEKKLEAVGEKNIFKKRDKVARFMIGKGFEPELVWEELKRIAKD